MKINSEDNYADILTKNVSVWLFQKLVNVVLGGFIGFERLFTNFQRENDWR